MGGLAASDCGSEAIVVFRSSSFRQAFGGVLQPCSSTENSVILFHPSCKIREKCRIQLIGLEEPRREASQALGTAVQLPLATGFYVLKLGKRRMFELCVRRFASRSLASARQITETSIHQ